MKRLTLAALGFCLTACMPSPESEIDSAIISIYGNYHQSSIEATADWDRTIFTRGTTQSISLWRTHLGAEPVDSLSEYGWLCECQDFDGKEFKATRRSLQILGGDRAEVTMEVRTGWDGVSHQRLILLHENGKWQLDDLFRDSMPKGLKFELAKALRLPPGS
jgi:hypothetical protein